VGSVAARISGLQAITWLKANDPGFTPPSTEARLSLGSLLTSFSPIARYRGRMKERKGQPRLALVFYGGLASSLLSLSLLVVNVVMI
jgi:hypothetical protein